MSRETNDVITSPKDARAVLRRWAADLQDQQREVLCVLVALLEHDEERVIRGFLGLALRASSSPSIFR